ncbi:MAG: hypothetical protein RLZZ504_972 [Bacteroidota bacterium]
MFDAVIGGFVGLKPLIEERIEVGLGTLDDGISKIFDVGVAEFPLFHVVFHGLQEDRVAEVVLQVVEHGGGFVVHVFVSATMSCGRMKVVGMGFEDFVGSVDGILHVAGKGAFEFGLGFFGEFAHAPGGEELGKAFIEGRAVGFVGSHHAEEPVVAHFMGDETLVAGVVTAIEGNHGVFHAIGGIGAYNFGVVVQAEIAAIGGDDFCGELGGLLPSFGVVFLGDGHALYTIPSGFTDAVGGIGGPGEIVHVYGLIVPCFVRAIGRNNHRGLRTDGFVFEIGDIELFSQGSGQNFLFVYQGACGFGDVVVGQCEGYVEVAVIAIKLLFYVLVGLPSEFSVVHADSGIPMHAVEVFVSVVVVNFHATADASAVEVGGKVDLEGDLLPGFEGGGQFDFEQGILDFEGRILGCARFVFDGGFFGVDLNVVDDGTQFLRFILSVGDLGAVLLV